jgi:hypothetical protein
MVLGSLFGFAAVGTMLIVAPYCFVEAEEIETCVQQRMGVENSAPPGSQLLEEGAVLRAFRSGIQQQGRSMLGGAQRARLANTENKTSERSTERVVPRDVESSSSAKGDSQVVVFT